MRDLWHPALNELTSIPYFNGRLTVPSGNSVSDGILPYE